MLRRISGATIATPVRPVIEIEPRISFSNVVNVFTKGNRRPAERAPLDGDFTTAWLERSGDEPRTWDALGAITANDMNDVLEKGVKFTEKGLSGVVSLALFKLTGKPETVFDLGQTLEDEAAATPGWGSSYVYSADIPTPQRLVTLGSNGAHGGGDAAATCGIKDPVSVAVARWLARTILGSLSLSILPHPETVEGFSVKTRGLGERLLTREIGEWLLSVGTLLRVQWALLICHAKRRRLEQLFADALRRAPRSREALEYGLACLEFVCKQPLHPLIAPVATGFYTGDVETRFGVFPLQYHVRGSEEIDGPDIGYEKERDAVSDLIRSVSEDYIGKTATRSLWSTGTGPISVCTLAEQIRSCGKISDSWDTRSRELGWGRPSLKIDTLRQNSSEYALCDGDSWAGEAGPIVLGLRPTLSAGNRALMGIGSAWIPATSLNNGEGATFPFSVIPVDGFAAVETEAVATMRVLLAAGMSMGDVGGEPAFAGRAGIDPTVDAMIEFYRGEGVENVAVEFYRDGVVPVPRKSGVVRQSFWGIWFASSGEKAASEVIADFEKSYAGSLVPLRESKFVRPRERHFKWRVVVQWARPNQFVHIENTIGEKTPTSLECRGNIVVDPSEDDSIGEAGGADVEAIVNSWVMRKSSLSAKETTLSTGNVEVKG